MTPSEQVTAIDELQPAFLHGLEPAAIQALIKAADCHCFRAGSVILRQGYLANKLLLLMRGRGRYIFTTESGQRLLLRWIPPGKVMGMATLMAAASHYFVSTEAIDDCHTLAWNKTTIRRLASCYPAIWENAFTMLANGVGDLIGVHASQTYDTAPQRIARVLVSFAESLGQKIPDGIELSIRNEDLASAANVTPFTASRVLNRWQRDGLVQKTRGKVILRSLEGLLLQEVSA